MEKQLNPNNICYSKYGGMLELMSSEDLPSYCFYNPWDINNNNNHNNHNIHNHDQNDLFDSALSSIVSFPVTSAPPPSGDGVMIKELIGRLGTICDSDTNNNNNSNSNCNSGYNTPINSSSSPTNINLMMSSGRFNCPIQSSLGSLNADPGFVERAAKYSCFGNFNHPPPNLNHNLEYGKLSRVNSDKRLGERENNGDSREGSSVSEQNPGGGGSGGVAAVKAQNDGNSRKRKTVSKAKIKETPSSSPPTSQDEKIDVENDETNAKRSKVEDDKKENGEQNNNNNNNNNAGETSKPEPLKDYIHVRARRGQATDSHSLAERVRREKISERMKFLQDLVPGCNKVTGKATVLDEIINYVQSLQRQVEFLSMKLSTVNPRVEFNMEALLSKEMLQSRGSSMQQAMYQVDQNSAQAFPYGYQSTQQLSLPSPNGAPNRNENHFSGNPMNGNGIRRNPGIPLPLIDGFLDPMTQMSNLWEDDLQSIVQMGITQNQSQSVSAGTMPNAQMKIEL